MGESRDKVIKAIKHYQDSLERHSKTKKSDKLLHAIERLSALPIRVWHLEETGVGRTVNGLKRYEGEVGESARNLVDKWKSMVKNEEEEELAKQEKPQEIDEAEELDEEALQIAEQPDVVNGNLKNGGSPKVKKRRRSEEKSERPSKKSKSSHHEPSRHKQRKKSESEDSDDSDSSDNASPPPKNKSHKTKRRRSSEGTSSSDNSSSDDDSDNSESSQSDSKHGKRKESSKHSKDSKQKDSSDKHRSKDKSSGDCKKSEPDQKHKESSSSRHKDKSDKENVSSKERSKSSSSSKHKHSNSDKEKSRSSEKNQKSPSKSDSKEKVSIKPPKIRDTEQLVNGIDSGSGASFADALGMLEAPVPLKSKKKKVVGAEVKASTSRSVTESPKKESKGSYSVEPKKDSEVPSLLKSPEELEPLNINDLSSLLPSITPNYRPLGLPVDHPRKGWSDEEALSRVISAKHQRTKVYSGNKAIYTKVPTLFDICSRVLQDNLDALEYTGGVPYTILKHILERANPNQLYQLEFHNPYLIEDTDELWQLHCQKEFRNEKREEMETWRDMYMRCLDERDARLKALTANIKQSQDKSLPVRQTKLAYVDSVVKPPRNIARKQAKNGMLVDFKRPAQTPTERLSQLAKAGEASKVSVPNPGRAAAERGGSSSSHSSSNLKPKKAPLMAKTLSLLKNRFGRR